MSDEKLFNWTGGGGSSMELVHPDMDNSQGSAWRAVTSLPRKILVFSHTSRYEQWNSRGSESDYKEHTCFLSGWRTNPRQYFSEKEWQWPFCIERSQKLHPRFCKRWLALPSTHHKSYVDEQGRLHIISTGHGDNKANRIELDIPDIQRGDNVTLPSMPMG